MVSAGMCAVISWVTYIAIAAMTSARFIFFSTIRVVFHTGPQTYMLLYFRSKEDSCSWGHPAYTMRALPYVGLPISGGCVPLHHHGSCVSESPSTARRSSFGCKFKGGEVSSPTHTQTALVSRFNARNQRSPDSRRTIGAQWCTSHILAVRRRRHRC